MLRFTVNGQTLTRKDTDQVVANSVNYLTANISYESTAWADGYAFGVMTSGDTTYKAGVVSGVLKIPAAALTKAGKLFLSIVYKNEDSGVQITTNVIGIDVQESGSTDGIEPDTPTLTTDNVDQIYQNADDIADLQNIINTGGGDANATANEALEVAKAAQTTANSAKTAAATAQTTADSKAPKSHASSATTYGLGSASYYGHVKLSDSTTSTSSTSSGVAATPAAVKAAKDAASNAASAAATAQSTANTAKTNAATAQTTANNAATAAAAALQPDAFKFYTETSDVLSVAANTSMKTDLSAPTYAGYTLVCMSVSLMYSGGATCIPYIYGTTAYVRNFASSAQTPKVVIKCFYVKD